MNKSTNTYYHNNSRNARSPLMKLKMRFSGGNGILSVGRDNIQFCNSLEGGVLLSQLIYWADVVERMYPEREGWFYKSYQEWRGEFCIAEKAVRQWVAKFCEFGFLEVCTKKNHKGHPTKHYRFLPEAFEKVFVRFLQGDEPETQCSSVPAKWPEGNQGAETQYPSQESPETQCSSVPAIWPEGNGHLAGTTIYTSITSSTTKEREETTQADANSISLIESDKEIKPVTLSATIVRRRPPSSAAPPKAEPSASPPKTTAQAKGLIASRHAYPELLEVGLGDIWQGETISGPNRFRAFREDLIVAVIKYLKQYNLPSNRGDAINCIINSIRKQEWGKLTGWVVVDEAPGSTASTAGLTRDQIIAERQAIIEADRIQQQTLLKQQAQARNAQTVTSKYRIGRVDSGSSVI
jgi:hypothetical protein